MKLVTKEQMREMDRVAIANYGIPSVLLMEHAAYGVFEQFKKLPSSHIIILCGPGNNGGDGLALARQLVLWSDHEVTIIMACETQKISSDSKIYYSICKSMDMRIVEYNSKEYRHQLLEEADYLVDGLLGTGLSKEVSGELYHIIAHMNASNKPIISIDIPSGICADTGRVLGIAVKAWKTITFAVPKIGLYVYPGAFYANEVVCVPIGIPNQVLDGTYSEVEAITVREVKSWLPTRPMRSHKGTFGKVLVIGGQRGMSGAVTLAAQSALKVGAGIVTAAVPQSIHSIMEQKLTEVMTMPLADVAGHLGIDAITQIEECVEAYSHIVIGPGIGRSQEISSILQCVLKSDKPCVIDADGLYGLESLLGQIAGRKVPIVITPHPGEMSHLLHCSIESLLENPMTYTREFAAKYGVIVVLKIERTIISDGKKIWINTTGNPALAKGGSGDVLAGMIGGMMAQGLNPLEASAFSVFCHGQAADRLVLEKSVHTVLPSDLIERLGDVFHNL